MLTYNKNEIIHDSIYWDTINWSKSIEFWEKHIPKNAGKLNTLELGCGPNGGLSVWLASKGYNVICSGYEGITETTKNIHKKYEFSDNISYSKIDALSIPYSEAFDIICFKSMLGGIVRDKDHGIAERVIKEIYNSLKIGGVLLFAENLISSKAHSFFRSKFGSLKNKWCYFTVEEIKSLLTEFSSFKYSTFGFTGCFGRNEIQRNMLGRLDSVIFDKILTENLHYIITGCAEKR